MDGRQEKALMLWKKKVKSRVLCRAEDRPLAVLYVEKFMRV